MARPEATTQNLWALEDEGLSVPSLFLALEIGLAAYPVRLTLGFLLGMFMGEFPFCRERDSRNQEKM